MITGWATRGEQPPYNKWPTSWWLNQPLWKIWVKMGSSSPIFGVKISKNIWAATTWPKNTWPGPSSFGVLLLLFIRGNPPGVKNLCFQHSNFQVSTNFASGWGFRLKVRNWWLDLRLDFWDVWKKWRLNRCSQKNGDKSNGLKSKKISSP